MVDENATVGIASFWVLHKKTVKPEIWKSIAPMNDEIWADICNMKY